MANRNVIGATTVWVNGDLRNIIEAMYYQSLRSGADGEYARGLADMAQAIAQACNTPVSIRQRQPVWIAVEDVEVAQ